MTQIASEAEARVALGLSSSITDDERAAITLFLPAAEKAVIDEIGYDPTQREDTEYYPRNAPTGGLGVPESIWDVSSDGRTAQQYYQAGGGILYPNLQLQRLPVRAIADIWVDYDAKHGQATGAFPSSTKWVQGSDYWAEYDQDHLGLSGCVFARSRWPLEPGTVKVQYTAGYSPDELAGRADTTGIDADGFYNRVGVNASALKRAVLIALTAQMHKWATHRKSTTTGWIPGVKQSENLGDYSYSLGGSSGELTAGLVVELPKPAVELCEPFKHWGLMRL